MRDMNKSSLILGHAGITSFESKQSCQREKKYKKPTKNEKQTNKK